MVEELIDVLDKNGERTGLVETKPNVHRNRLKHAAVHVWIYSKDGKVLLQKRAITKQTWPGRYDVSAAGHVASGETPVSTAQREVAEELGLRIVPSGLNEIFTISVNLEIMPGYYENEFDYVYLYAVDGPFDFKKNEEVDEIEWMPLRSFERDVTTYKRADLYVPHHYYPRLIKVLKERLGESINY